MVNGLDKVIQEATGITTYLAENPLECVALGTGKALEDIEKLQDSLTSLQKASAAK